MACDPEVHLRRRQAYEAARRQGWGFSQGPPRRLQLRSACLLPSAAGNAVDECAKVPVPAIKLTVLVLVWWCGMISSTPSVFIYRCLLAMHRPWYRGS